LLRSLAQVPADRQVEVLRDIMDRGLSAQAAEAYIAELLVDAGDTGAPASKRGRRRLHGLDVRPADQVAVEAEMRPITVRAGEDVVRVDRVVVDVRQTNVARLVGQAKRRNWQVEAEEWLAALEAAIAEDRAAIERQLGAEPASNFRPQIPGRRARSFGTRGYGWYGPRSGIRVRRPGLRVPLHPGARFISSDTRQHRPT
jgi:hypothetical protein